MTAPIDALIHEMSRRGFLKGASLSAAGVAAARLSLGSPKAAVGGELHIMAWEGYDLTKELEAWRKANNVQVQAASITTQDDVHTPFLAGNPPVIDLAEFNQAYSNLYINDLQIVKPLNISQIPNYNRDNLFPEFLDKPTWFSNGKHWGVPWIWGFSTMVYNPAKIPEPKSYTDLLDPKLKGRIAIQDDMTGNFPLIARLAGFGDKYPMLTKDEMRKAFDNYAKYRNQARVVSINFGDTANFFVSGEIDAVLISDPAIINQVHDQGMELKATLPKEGPVLWVDAWFITKSAQNIDSAHAFINAALDPQVQAAVAMAVRESPVSRQAVSHLSDSARSQVDYTSVDKIFQAGLPGIPAAQVSDKSMASYADWLEAWESFKAGN
jgi:spermidine/putrescine transport system substrate-binding protein